MSIAWYKDKIGCWFLFLVSLILFTRAVEIHGLEYRDDEIFYVQSTQEMLQDHNYLSPTYFGDNRFQKPILFYWFILASYKIFGINWFAARAVAALFGALTVMLTWLMARDFFGRKIANLSGMILMTTPMFLRHAKNAVPDMPLNFFIVLSMFCLAKMIFYLDREQLDGEEKVWLRICRTLFFVSIGFGFMVKGLAAVSVPLISLLVYLAVYRDKRLLSSLKLGGGAVITALIIIPWFSFMVYQHGKGYIDFMLVNETKNRMFSVNPVSWAQWVGMFFGHIGYYLGVLLSYFAPWSIFAFVGIPSILRFNRLWLERHRRMVSFLLIWILTVLSVFSLMYFRINHYMLVLSTPFAIMISLFFLEKLDKKILLSRWIFRFQKIMALVIFSVSIIAAIILIVVFLKLPVGWAIALTIVASFIGSWMVFTPRQRVAPWVLAVTLMLAFANSRILSQVGITFHSVLQRFAETIQHNQTNEAVIAVGSNDLHEKEFQAYFSKPVIKAATSSDEETSRQLKQVFAHKEDVFCLITAADYDKYLKVNYSDIEVIQAESMFRKRIFLDKRFLDGLFDLNREVIFPYFMEKILLVRRISTKDVN